MNYYNEFDPKAAAWLKQLIQQNLIPQGDVDTRSITEVKPHELHRYTQCHFFAGIGGWSYALQLANWPATRPVWTGSCPCQPFSSAGKGLGAADERHLWPVFHNLIKECRPQYVFGEQVASAIGKGWLDGISADLGSEGYACGSAVLGAHSVGAPHIRQRLYWVAYDSSARLEGSTGAKLQGDCGGFARSGETSSGLANPKSVGGGEGQQNSRGGLSRSNEKQRTVSFGGCSDGWSNYNLIPCRDGKQRRIESSTFPLVARLPKGMVYSSDPSAPINPQETAEARVMRLKGYGNAIVPQVAAQFITAAQAILPPL